MATRSLGTLTLDLIAKTGGFVQGMSKAERESDKWRRKVKKNLKDVGKAFAVLGVATGGAAVAVVRSTIKQENAIRQLEQRLASTEGIAGKTSAELQGFASSLQKVTTFGDEAILEMQGLLLTFTNIRGEVFNRATPAILDMSVAMGTDLRSSAIQLGKALNDPIRGITALSRTGIQFTDQQRELIKSLVESGRAAEAQNVILAELETQFGGAARAAADTFGGALEQAKNAFGDLLEAPGGLKDGKKAIQDLTDILQDPETIQAAAALTNAVITGFTKASAAIRDTIQVTQFLAQEFAAITVGIASDDIVRLEKDAQKIREVLNSNSVGAFGERIRFFGPDGIVEFLNDNELRAKLTELETAIEGYYSNLNNRPSIPAQITATDNGGGAPTFVFPSGTSDAIAKQIEDLQFQAEVIGKSADQIKLLKLEAEGATPAQLELARAALETVTQFEAAEELQKNYKDLLSGLRTEEEVLTDQMRERLAVLDAITDVTDEQRKSTLARIADAATVDSPDFSGGDTSEAQAELEDWYATQLALLDQFRKDRADLNATWDEEELRVREEYERRTTEIQAENESQRRELLSEGYSALLDVVGEYFGGLQGEEAAYAKMAISIGQTLLDERKREALQKIVANTQSAAMGAYDALASIPYVGPALGAVAAGVIYAAGGAATAKVTGLAHDGIDSIPQTGTWLLEEGERVTTAETSAKLDRTLDDVQRNQSRPANDSGGNIRIVNSFDAGEVVGGYMGSSAGERDVLNIVKSNETLIRTIARG